MQVQFDTGSSLIYVLTEKCKNGCPEGLKKFQMNDSTTLVHKKQELTQAYGQGEVQGEIV